MWYFVLGDSGILFTRSSVLYLIHCFANLFIVLFVYICPCFHAYYDGEYYY